MKYQEYCHVTSSSKEALQRIARWQDNIFSLKLRCGFESCKGILMPRELLSQEIILLCRGCSFEFSARRFPIGILQMTEKVESLVLDKLSDEKFGDLTNEIWNNLSIHLSMTDTREDFPILFATSLARIFGNPESAECFRGFAFKGNLLLKDLTYEHLSNAAGNHAFDDFPELFGLEKIEGRIIRSFFQTDNERSKEAIEKVLIEIRKQQSPV